MKSSVYSSNAMTLRKTLFADFQRLKTAIKVINAEAEVLLGHAIPATRLAPYYLFCSAARKASLHSLEVVPVSLSHTLQSRLKSLNIFGTKDEHSLAAARSVVCAETP